MDFLARYSNIFMDYLARYFSIFMDFLARYFNIFNTPFVIIGVIILIIVSFVYTKRKWRRRRYNHVRLSLVSAYNKSVKEKDNTIFLDNIKNHPSKDVAVLACALFARKKRSELIPIIPLFEEESFQAALRFLLKKGTTQQRIQAAHMLSYYPTENTIMALNAACKDKRQEVVVAAALNLVNCSPNISLTDLMITLTTSIPQKSIFCFLRLLPSNVLLQYESVIADIEKKQPDATILGILRDISTNYITPYIILACEDQRDYIQTLFGILLGLQHKYSGIVRSCYILNSINELCYQEETVSLQELITEYFDFKKIIFDFSKTTSHINKK